MSFARTARAAVSGVNLRTARLQASRSDVYNLERALEQPVSRLSKAHLELLWQALFRVFSSAVSLDSLLISRVKLDDTDFRIMPQITQSHNELKVNAATILLNVSMSQKAISNINVCFIQFQRSL